MEILLECHLLSIPLLLVLHGSRQEDEKWTHIAIAQEEYHPSTIFFGLLAKS
jgi:hypothetical protein